jgi:uncharacterized protein GlcG (DUF336 family)
MSITLSDARVIADAAFAESATKGLTKVSVVITDPGGHIRFAMRSDQQGIFGIETATAKAVTALGFNRPTLALAALFTPQATSAIGGATGGRFAPLGGGVVITNVDGVIVGAAGLSGGLPDVDDAIMTNAVHSAGFQIIN